MSKSPILKAYISEIDLFIEQFDKEHPKLSYSQQKERDKYLKIYTLRDNSDRQINTQSLWEGF